MNPNLREEEQRRQLEAREAQFLELILRAYRAETVAGFATFHGKKAGRLVAVGPVNLPVTRLSVDEIVLECRKHRISRVPKEISADANAPFSRDSESSERSASPPEWEERWTGDFIFENEWQSFRTKKDRSLELTSVYHECPRPAEDRGEGGGHFRE